MFILSTMTDIGVYKTMIIIKIVANIIFTVIPLIVIGFAMKDIFLITINPENAKKNLFTTVNRIIAGLIVFLLPTVINYTLSLVENSNTETLISYYNNASLEKVKELEEKYQKELAAEKAQREAKLKEAQLKRAEEERKRNEMIEELRKKEEEENQSGNYDSSNETNGTYGTVVYKDGVFYIPNKRATSDSDIPKQSGQYGLNPIFWSRLEKLINDAAAKGYTIGVTSGWRSYSSQLSLWNNSSRSCSTRSSWVACPGGSRHGFGIAADLKFNGTSCSGSWDCNEAAKWVHANAANYGLKFRMSWEPWHIEPDNVSGGSFGSCTASC